MSRLTLKCLEPLTALSCGAVAASLGLLDGGLAAGTIIGGVGLVARFKEQCAKKGLDDAEIFGKMRLSIIREWDHKDQTDVERDQISLADAAMAKHLVDCRLTREELGQTAISSGELYPERAARLIVDRLAKYDPMFDASEQVGTPLARRFAIAVVERSLKVVKDDPAYASLLTLDVVIAIGESVAKLQDNVDEIKESTKLIRRDVGQIITGTGPLTPLPFQLIEDVVQLWGREGEGIVPTKKEYEAGLVHSHALIDEVENALVANDGALLSGRGSAGKTTLSILIAQRAKLKSMRCYYLDVTGHIDQPDVSVKIVEAMIKFGDDKTLFVVDNMHLEPLLASTIVDHWQSSAKRPNLLLLARQIRRPGNSWRVDASLSDLDLTEFELTNSGAELEGAYRRIYHREYRKPASKVNESRLAEWVELFQGDLLAFSAAVNRRITDRYWSLELTAEDASEYVLERYLYDATAEKDDLIALAAVYDREFSLPVSCFENEALSNAVDRGVVWIEKRGPRGEWKFYRFVHPGIAKLILRAALLTEADAADMRQEILLAAPRYSAITAMHVFQNGGFYDEATELLSALWTTDDFPIASLPLSYWKRFFEVTVANSILSNEELQAKAMAWLNQSESEEFATFLASSPLHFLVNFLRYAQEAMPDVWTKISRSLALEPAITQLTQNSVSGPLDYLANFLRYTQKAMPEVWKKVTASLSSKTAIIQLTNNALSSSLESLANFLSYAQKAMPEVWKKVTASLSSKTAIEQLTNNALSSSLEHSANFLRYAQKAMPDLWGQLWSALWRPDNNDLLANLIFHQSPDKCAAFLRYVDEVQNSKNSSGQIASLLLQPEFESKFENWFTSFGPEHIVALIGSAPRLAAGISKLDNRKCQRSWTSIDFGEPHWFPSFAKLCLRVNRRDLAEVAAQQYLVNAKSTDFVGTAATIKTLSFIMSFLNGGDFDIQQKFLERCVKSSWLDQQFGSTGAQLATLAGSVKQFALHPSPEVRQYFGRPSLLDRLERDFPDNRSAAADVAVWLQFLGSVRLLIDATPRMRPVVISKGKIDKALAMFSANASGEGIQFIQSALWMGLHEWLYLSKTRHVVDHMLADGILNDFRDAKSIDRPVQDHLNAVMINWMSKGQASDWKLPVPELSLFGTLSLALRAKQSS